MTAIRIGFVKETVAVAMVSSRANAVTQVDRWVLLRGRCQRNPLSHLLFAPGRQSGSRDGTKLTRGLPGVQCRSLHGEYIVLDVVAEFE
jgi:hypothetical protein